MCMNTYQRLCTEDHDEEVKEAMDRPVKLAIRAAERVTGGEHPSHAARLQVRYSNSLIGRNAFFKAHTWVLSAP